MKKIVIRDMDEQDIPSVVQIERQSFSTPWSASSFLNEIHKSRSIARVAILDGTVIAYICAEQVMDEGHILNLAVHADYRRMRIAVCLVENVIDALKLAKCRFLYLEVRASNLIAQGLYKSLSFKIIGIRKTYYLAPEEDAVIMMLEI
ncbi:MAG: ribosomal protein S18-alanine N-acetyltransferase [Thermodesulfovibrionales bacterium]